MNGLWRDKHVIITGASSGIGRALAEYVVAHGGRVGLIARREDRLKQTVDELGDDRTAFATADVGDRPALLNAVALLEQRLGPCEVAVANAGAHRDTPGDAFRADDLAAVFETNVLGAANLFEAVLPDMVQRRRGRIAAVASIAGLLGLPKAGAYSSSKAAVITLMQSLRVDLYQYGIYATTICPGFVDTPFIAGHDRRVMKFMLTATEAAARAARAIERRKAEAYFPWPAYLLVRTAGLLPFPLYRLLARHHTHRGPSPT